MGERKNLKIQPETYQLLKDGKGKYETWDGYLQRIAKGDNGRQ